jgi:outer membrane protein assembly factor BamB
LASAPRATASSRRSFVDSLANALLFELHAGAADATSEPAALGAVQVPGFPSPKVSVSAGGTVYIDSSERKVYALDAATATSAGPMDRA